MSKKAAAKKDAERRDDAEAVMADILKTRGLASRIAEECGIQRQAVYQWKRVPIERVHQIAPLVGMSPTKLRPDIFKR
ncbi:MAG: YdaS family helix-turn-helix protein [Verrucomicrobiota bacterium]